MVPTTSIEHEQRKHRGRVIPPFLTNSYLRPSDTSSAGLFSLPPLLAGQPDKKGGWGAGKIRYFEILCWIPNSQKTSLDFDSEFCSGSMVLKFT